MTMDTGEYRFTAEDLAEIREAAKDFGEGMSAADKRREIEKHAGEQAKAAADGEAARAARESDAEAEAWLADFFAAGDSGAAEMLAERLRGEPLAVPLNLADEPPPRRWLIPDWVPAGRAGLLAGRGGAGKTRLALQLAAGMAGGFPAWLPGGPELEIGPGKTLSGASPALIATWEDEPAEAVRRIRALGRTAGGEPLHEAAGDRVFGADMRGRGPLWKADRNTATGDFTEAGFNLLCQAKRGGVRLLIVDSAAGAFAGGENDRAHVRQFMGGLDAWAQAADCAVLVIAHPPKTGKRDDADAWPASGSGDWMNAARFVLEMAEAPKTEEANYWQKLSLWKGNYTTKQKPPPLRLTGYPWQVSAPPPPGGKDAAAGDGGAFGDFEYGPDDV